MNYFLRQTASCSYEFINNALSEDGWSKMEQGIGFDDPDFIEAISKLYSEKYHSFTGVNRGAIGALEFRGEDGAKEMQRMIQQARDEVIRMRNPEVNNNK